VTALVGQGAHFPPLRSQTLPEGFLEVAGLPDLDVDPLAGGGSPVAGAIALSTARFLTGGEIDRLKMCDNAGCRWVFYDETRNRRRRWCGPCGNVDRVRRFRERRRLERAGLTAARR
jgi:predicted RNA-binding Zn ribbon-like protein